MFRLIGIAAVALATATSALAEPSWTRLDRALGRSGTVQPDGVHKYSFPRSDLNVTLDGVRLKPALALGSWLAFEPTGNTAVMMGDLVLPQDEVNPVMSRLLQSGLTITALHNHLLRSVPGTMYMLFSSTGKDGRFEGMAKRLEVADSVEKLGWWLGRTDFVEISKAHIKQYQ